ncbi:hypothetical protein A3860_23695 [Niastella vici]|uniref:Piwi domain-containing protein n=1 Tax=Niastella vici TaxID=1703345 RepID=A0A1V9FYP4_9BACT|nr:hypothetical protein [Niastella vici]OQP63356.1 hypothetical protein A3860_23695 [Niastella vici]
MLKIIHINEPNLIFGFDQKTIDPRDGLVLFGPHQPLYPYSLRIGVIGLQEDVIEYKNFVAQLNRPILSTQSKYKVTKSLERSRPSFPGFEAVFNVKWPVKPEVELIIGSLEIQKCLKNPNRILRANDLVDLYLNKIRQVEKKEDAKLNLWFILIPTQIYETCNASSWGRSIGKGTHEYVEKTEKGQISLSFSEYADYDNKLARILDTASDFHNLLKARLIQEQITVPVQLIVDKTLRFRNRDTNIPFQEYLKANFAWTQSTTVYYKLGRLPWKLGDVREGVCYIGLVYKKLPNERERNVCSAAQMFLKDGDGSVFRGNIGLWESEKPHEYHLDEMSAQELIGMALDDYKEKWNIYPNELFIHAKANFNDIEWQGFLNAVQNRSAHTSLVGILIKDLNELKLYRQPYNQLGNYGVMRGTALIVDEKEGYLCTKGFIPRLNTSNSLEIPRNLRVKIVRGNAHIETVLKDILALTKLNYNACAYGDGSPVTLKFSNKIGSILTSIPDWKVDTRQFMFYI